MKKHASTSRSGSDSLDEGVDAKGERTSPGRAKGDERSPAQKLRKSKPKSAPASSKIALAAYARFLFPEKGVSHIKKTLPQLGGSIYNLLMAAHQREILFPAYELTLGPRHVFSALKLVRLRKAEKALRQALALRTDSQKSCVPKNIVILETTVGQLALGGAADASGADTGSLSLSELATVALGAGVLLDYLVQSKAGTHEDTSTYPLITLGAAWGRHLSATIGLLRPTQRHPGLRVLQLVGGIDPEKEGPPGQPVLPVAGLDPFMVSRPARRLSKLYNGLPTRRITYPACINDRMANERALPIVREAATRLPSYEYLFGKSEVRHSRCREDDSPRGEVRDLDIAITGIGDIRPGCYLEQLGVLNADKIDRLTSKRETTKDVAYRAAGDMLGFVFADEQYDLAQAEYDDEEPINPLNSKDDIEKWARANDELKLLRANNARILGLRPSWLQRLIRQRGTRCLTVASEPYKARALLGAIRHGLITDLVITLDLANAMQRELETAKRSQ